LDLRMVRQIPDHPFNLLSTNELNKSITFLFGWVSFPLDISMFEEITLVEEIVRRSSSNNRGTNGCVIH
jgi:hypothetical protein